MNKCDYDPVIYNFSPSPRVAKRLRARLAKWKCCPVPINGRPAHVPELGRSESGPPFDVGFPVTGGAPR